MKVTKMTAIAVMLLSSLAPLVAAAPANDNFANATVIPSTLPQSVTGLNVDATAETGEPLHSTDVPANENGRNTVWWKWTAPYSGAVTITTAGSSTSGYEPHDGPEYILDTQLAVYTGTAVSSLTVVGRNEDAPDVYGFRGGLSALVFTAAEGTTYHIAVDSWQGEKGMVKLNLTAEAAPPPPPPTKYALTVTVAPSAAGTVTLDPAQPEGGYDAGTVVTLTASGEGFSGWAGAASGTATTVQVTMNAAKNVVAVFNSDNQIFFFNTVSRGLAAWYLQGTSYLGATSVRNGQTVATGWTPVGMADFDDDGSSDMLLQSDDGRIAVWFFNGTAFSNAQMIRNGQSAGAGWRVVGTGDFDGNGSSDVLFQHTSGRMAIWFMNGSAFVNAGTVRDGIILAPDWRICGAADLNNDSKADIILQHNNGRCAAWLMNGKDMTSATILRDGQPVTPGWKLVGFADFNGNSTPDFLWQHDGGQMAVWYMNGTTFVSTTAVRSGQPAGAGWKALGAN